MRAVFTRLIAEAGSFCQGTVAKLLESKDIEIDSYGVSSLVEPGIALKAYIQSESCAVDPGGVNQQKTEGCISSNIDILSTLEQIGALAASSTHLNPREDGSAFAVLSCIWLSVLIGFVKGEWLFFDSHKIGNQLLGSSEGVCSLFSSHATICVLTFQEGSLDMPSLRRSGRTRISSTSTMRMQGWCSQLVLSAP